MRFLQRHALLLFIFATGVGMLEHGLLLQLQPQLTAQVLQAFALGLGYDLMNGALLGLIGLLLPFPEKIKRLGMGLLGGAYFLFLFLDYHYVLQFGTHLPFSTLEYLEQPGAFASSAGSVAKSATFWMLFLGPLFLLTVLLWRVSSPPIVGLTRFLRFGATALLLFVVGGAGGTYSNSYVSKNMEDPLTSAAPQYFFDTRNREQLPDIPYPKAAFATIAPYQSGSLPDDPRFAGYPLVRTHQADACRKTSKTPLTEALCKAGPRPNMLLVMLESFRGAEVSAYGSKLGLTPELDRWKERGIWFTEFYANGFQTRHAQVASYCSLFPNYGAAVMKRFANNHLRCLPEILRERGYATSWVFGSDSNFDKQNTFLLRIGFEKLVDEFDFPESATRLGWGYSDKDLFRIWESVLDETPEPFFSSALTITNHHPFEVPEKYKLGRGDKYVDRYRESMYYTDAMLGQFLERIQSKPWYQNTLIIITADTSNDQPPERQPQNFEEFVKLRSQIPLLILGGKISGGLVIMEPSSQVDLTPTLMDLLGQPYTTPWVGRSLLDSSMPARAYTNRPTDYWAVMERKSRFYREWERIDHSFGVPNPEKTSELKQLGKSWLTAVRWLLQENRIWPPE